MSDDCLTHGELKHMLSQFTNLENVEVLGEMGVIHTKRVMAQIKGVILVHGQHYQYDLEIDLRTVTNADHVLKMVEGLNKSFEKLARHTVKG